MDLEQVDGARVAVAGLGMTAAPPGRPGRLVRRVSALIAAQLTVAAGFMLIAGRNPGVRFGSPWVVTTLALSFALTGFFGMSLEFHRHRFTFTLAEAVLAVGFFFVGPIGLAIAAAVGEGVNMVAQRHAPLKVAFNVSNRLAATTAAGVAFAALGHTDVHQSAAWGAALGAALCFSAIDVVSTAAVLSIVEETRFHNVFVRSASTGLLATLTAAPVGLVALDLAEHGPFVPLLLAPIAAAVAFNARYAVAQRDEHLRFERLYESSARTASLVAFDDALRSLAAETCSLGTGIAALCCATGADGKWRGAYSDDDGQRPAARRAVEAAVRARGATATRKSTAPPLATSCASHPARKRGRRHRGARERGPGRAPRVARRSDQLRCEEPGGDARGVRAQRRAHRLERTVARGTRGRARAPGRPQPAEERLRRRGLARTAHPARGDARLGAHTRAPRRPDDAGANASSSST